jgi:hypothetical protein
MVLPEGKKLRHSIRHDTWIFTCKICCSNCELPPHRYINCFKNNFVLSVFPEPDSPLKRERYFNDYSSRYLSNLITQHC